MSKFSDSGIDSAYRFALDSTRDALTRRVVLYRGLAASLIGLCTVSIATAFAAPAVAACLLLLSPAFVAAFVWFDRREVRRWSDQLAELHATEGLDISLLVKALDAVPALPRNTLDGMMRSLRGRLPGSGG